MQNVTHAQRSRLPQPTRTMSEVRASLAPQERQLLALLEPTVGQPVGKSPERRGSVLILDGVSYAREPVGAISQRLAAAIRDAKDAGPLEDLVVGELGINLPARRYVVIPTSGRSGSGPFPLPEDFDYAKLLVGDAAASRPGGPLGDLVAAALADYPRLAPRGSFHRLELSPRERARLEHLKVDDPSGILARLSHLSGTRAGGPPTRAELLVDVKGGDFYLASFGHHDHVLGPFELPESARSARGMAALRRRSTAETGDGFERATSWVAPVVMPPAAPAPRPASTETTAARQRFKDKTGLVMPADTATVAEAAEFARRLSRKDRLEALRVAAPRVVTDAVLAQGMITGGLLGPAYQRFFTPGEHAYLLEQERRAARLSQHELTVELHQSPRVATDDAVKVETPLAQHIRTAVLEAALKRRFDGVRDFGN